METASHILMAAWDTLKDMSPYLLFGFLVAGILSVLIPGEKIERHLGGQGFKPVLKAALLGVPLPLCSCGVIPVTASLRQHGAGRGAAMSFLLSTPQTGVDSIMVTFSLLGPVFAVFRPLAALLSGIAGGLIIEKSARVYTDPRPDARENGCCSCCHSRVSGKSAAKSMFNYGFVTLPGEISLPLVAGIGVAGAISALVPDNFFAGMAAGSGIGALLLMMAAGIPLYVCATASVPIAAAMIAKGISPGAALVFLMTGPATNAAAIAMVWKLFGRGATAVYLAVVAVSAIISGLLLNAVFDLTGLQESGSFGHALPDWAGSISAIILAGILFNAAWRKPGKASRHSSGNSILMTGKCSLKPPGHSEK